MNLPSNLTTLANAREWQGASGTNSDAIFNRLIPAVSQQVYEYLQRDSFVSREVTDILDGTGGQSQFVKEWPVTAISSVIVGNQTIPESAPTTGGGSGSNVNWGYGYVWERWSGVAPGDPCCLSLRGGRFIQGPQTVQVTYTAGYLNAESWSAPNDGKYRVTLNQAKGPWLYDNGVVYASTGEALTLVLTDPQEGQYMVLPPSDTGVGTYQFSEADAVSGALLTISYSFVPYSVEQVVLDLINERMSSRTRIGVKSRSLSGQETTTYDTSGLPPYAARALQPYRRVIPL